MCSPTLAMGGQAFGAGMSAFGSFFQAKADKSALRSQARILDINAGVQENVARQTIAAGTVEESRVKLKGAQVKGRQIAEYASRGIDIAGSDSALAVLTGTDLITDVDAATIRANAMRAALGQRFEASNMRARATSARASAASISPGLALGTSLIQSAGQVAKSWYAFDKEGAFDKPTKQGTVTMGIVEGDQPPMDLGDFGTLEDFGDNSFGWGSLFKRRKPPSFFDEHGF